MQFISLATARGDFGALNRSREGNTVNVRIYECDERGCFGTAQDKNRISAQRTVGPVGLPSSCGTRVPADWVALGYFASLDHRARYVLDAGSHCHSAWGHCARAP